MIKAILKLGYKCNNNCIFCHSNHKKKHKDITFEEVKRRIKYLQKKKIDLILLSGGEVTIRKDFTKIMKFFKYNKIKFGLITNGRVLSYAKVCNLAIESGLKYVYISLHGPKKVHNNLTRTESYDQTIKAIQNISKNKDIELIVNTVVTRQNLDYLIEVVNIAIRNKIKKLKFSNLLMYDAVKKNFEALVPNIHEASNKILQAMEYSLKSNIKVYYDGFPKCLMSKFKDEIDDLESNEIKYITECYENKLCPVNNKTKIKMAECLLCEETRCPGIEKEYCGKKGDPKVIPFIKKKPNSINYFLKKRYKIKNTKNLECPIDWNLKGYQKEDLLLINKKEINHYSCLNKDFNEDEIKKIKELKQIYVNESSKPTSNNFVKDFKKIELYLLCKSCNKKDECTKCYITNSFQTNPESSLMNELKKLKGKVLDVGCGRIQHLNLIKEKVQCDEIEYTGIDSFEEIDYMKNKDLDLNLYKTSLENFQTKELYDQILFQGSLNHIQRPDLAIKKCLDLLTSSGSILISDSGIFGLVQTKLRENNIPDIQEGKLRWEHYHNLLPKDIAKLCQKLPLTICTINDISEKNPFWVIKLRKV